MLGIANRFPYLYFSMRVGTLGITLGAVGLWLVTGFNLVEGGVPIIGIQWSTFATFTFWFYILMANYQCGGIGSFKQIGGLISMDFHFLTTLKRSEYPQEHIVNPWRAILTAVCVCIGALFAFEVVWVFAYDYFQFGSLLWPVYFAQTQIPVLIRNFGLFLMPLILAWLILTMPLDLTKNRFSVKFRLNESSAIFIGIAVWFWTLWVIMPHQAVSIAALEPGQIIGPTAGSFDVNNCYVWPTQNYFPQNTYTFYPCALYGVQYTPPQILGFFDPDNTVHIVNVLTKFVTFATVCFPFLAFVKKEP